jgi:dinuclear metal center YbgI/SA1388 family protein
MIVRDVVEAIHGFAPSYMKYDWDNEGLLCGSMGQSVHKILVALDPFESVCQEAAELDADLLVTHHPLIFRAPKSVTDETTVGRSILFLASHGISAVNAHTNLDCCPGGVNDVLAETLGLSDIQVVQPMGSDAEGRPYGLIHSGTVEEMPLEAFLQQVKDRLGTPVLRYVNCGKSVRKVAVGGGSCGDAYPEALAAGCDTLVTADVKYNQFWDAYELGLNLIDAGHFYTENPVCAVLAQKLREAFPDAEVIVSKHSDCMKFF